MKCTFWGIKPRAIQAFSTFNSLMLMARLAHGWRIIVQTARRNNSGSYRGKKRVEPCSHCLPGDGRAISSSLCWSRENNPIWLIKIDYSISRDQRISHISMPPTPREPIQIIGSRSGVVPGLVLYLKFQQWEEYRILRSP